MNFLTDLVQGSKEWKEVRKQHFTASECPAMLGLSKYTTRSELLKQKATGVTPEVSTSQQRLFDKGHEVEELARPIAEAFIGEEVYPATITNEVEGLKLLASMDGLTMMGDQGWEHKIFNAEFAEMVSNGIVPDTHWPQLEHQMLVSGAEKILFTVSDGTEEKREQVWYESQPERRKQVLNGWKQFKEDLANYEAVEVAEKVEAGPVLDLPAINYKMNGLALESNLEAYKQAATDLVALSEKALESDQDFADAEARQKVFTKAEKDIKDACDRVMGEIDSIDTFVKDMRFISEQIRQARLAEGKQIKARKEELRQEILNKANQEASNALNEAMAKVNAKLPNFDFNPAGAMKGKRTIESLQDAADGEVAKAKIQINEFVELAMGNALHLSTQAQGYDFLFNDWAQIAFKPTEDFKMLVTTRIATYQAEQKAKEEAQRERIRQEEQAKLQREAEARARAEREAEAQKKREEQAKRDAEEKARVDAEVEQKPEIEKKESPTNEPKEEVQPEQEAKPATSVVRQEQSPVRQYGLMELNAMDQLAKLVEEANKPYASDLRKFVESVKANNLKKVA
ncbi:YqaJ viral recombinase family protein [Alteromonas mediterranea]|uniref:YqaJ viral recombinase family protein n=1 Tax=Alteromonas mediterranea TaxID=314275 RepID=UPI00241C6C3E|nr:YqaJ viral recombinase family protein [Alteromonas mediterranea]